MIFWLNILNNHKKLDRHLATFKFRKVQNNAILIDLVKRFHHSKYLMVFISKFGVDTVESEPPKVSLKQGVSKQQLL